MALIKEDSVDDTFDRFVDSRIIINNICSLAAELQSGALLGSRDGSGNQFTDIGRSSERNLVDTRVINESSACGTSACDDIYNTIGKSRLLADLGKEKRGQRCRFCWLKNNGVTCCQGWSNFPRQHEHRKIPRNDLTDDSVWLWRIA